MLSIHIPLAVAIGVLAYTIYHYKSTYFSNVVDEESDSSSSVWCSTMTNQVGNKLCTFNNIYYLPQLNSFGFFLTDKSIISGVESIKDLKSITLSSVENHNSLFMKLIMLQQPVPGNTLFDPIYLVTRFKCDNIHHVIHDEVLPIFTTYNHICDGSYKKCVQKITLAFIDDCTGDFNYEWYNILSYKKPINLNDLKEPVLFKTVHTGVSRETVWFQYGFTTPQGPVKASFSRELIHKFADHVRSSFKLPRLESRNTVVFFSRKINRRINEDFVLREIVHVYQELFNSDPHVYILDSSMNTTKEILSVVSRSKLLVGMHGSSMVYSIFLPPDAAIVELFPYGIQPQFVSPVRAFCLLPGMAYSYLSWRNFKEENSIGYPDRPALLGGISHLPLETQDRIKSVKLVPSVECCHDPVYLYRMFQDTVVDDSFKTVLKQALLNQRETQSETDNYNVNAWFYPGPVGDVTCRLYNSTTTAIVSWNKPSNVVGLSVMYHVLIEVNHRVLSLKTESTGAQFTIREEFLQNVDNKVWVTAVFEDHEGLDVYAKCV